MDPERYQQIQDLFRRVNETPAADRAAFLERESAVDPALVEEVRELLEFDEGSPHVDALERGEAMAQLAGEVGTPEVVAGQQFGEYVLGRRLGSGGMGAVYEARQLNPDRPVALKLLRPDLVSTAVLGRFHREAELLGRLQHPGIAHVYQAFSLPVHTDVGEFEQPAIAMELVDGEELDRYAERNGLTAAQRIELAVSICDAVEHAHERGVIHRDLKPANILVEPSGQPKVLDFGIARAVDVEAPLGEATETCQVIGTLSYMSPEQVRGERGLDARSDVYTLGVVIYELLTGRMPHEVRLLPFPEAMRAISERTPDPLSTGDQTFDRDLEIILAKALEQDRDRRYSSAAELAAELRRFLGNEPIIARAPSTFYRLTKFARRNKWLVATLLALAGGLVTSLVLADRIRQERDSAESARQVTSAINVFWVDRVLKQASPLVRNGVDYSLDQILDAVAAEIGDSFADSPEIGVALNGSIGETYLDMGRPQEAEDHLRRSLATIREFEQPARELELTRLLARTLVELDRNDEAAATIERVVQRERELAVSPRDRAETQLVRGKMAAQASDYSTARRAYGEAETLFASLDPPDLERTALALSQRSLMEAADYNPELAEQLLSRALEIRQRAPEPDRVALAEAHVQRAQIFRQLGRHDEVEGELTRALELRLLLFGADHLRYAEVLATYASHVNHVLRDHPRGLELMTQAIEVFERRLPSDHQQLALHYSDYGRILEQSMKLTEAEDAYRKALAIFADRRGERAESVALTLGNLGRVLIPQGKLEDAVEVLEEAVDRWEVSTDVGEEHHLAIILQILGRAYYQLHEYEDAEIAYLDSYDRAASVFPDDHQVIQDLVPEIVQLYQALDDDEEALDWAEKLRRR